MTALARAYAGTQAHTQTRGRALVAHSRARTVHCDLPVSVHAPLPAECAFGLPGRPGFKFGSKLEFEDQAGSIIIMMTTRDSPPPASPGSPDLPVKRPQPERDRDCDHDRGRHAPWGRRTQAHPPGPVSSHCQWRCQWPRRTSVLARLGPDWPGPAAYWATRSSRSGCRRFAWGTVACCGPPSLMLDRGPGSSFS